LPIKLQKSKVQLDPLKLKFEVPFLIYASLNKENTQI